MCPLLYFYSFIVSTKIHIELHSATLWTLHNARLPYKPRWVPMDGWLTAVNQLGVLLRCGFLHLHPPMPVTTATMVSCNLTK